MQRTRSELKHSALHEMSKRSLAKSRDKAPVSSEEPDKLKTTDTSALHEAPKPAHHHNNRRPAKHHNYAVHRVEAHSPLSSESPEQNFRGLFNLAGIILVSALYMRVKYS